jgi:hypothetical protein
MKLAAALTGIALLAAGCGTAPSAETNAPPTPAPTGHGLILRTRTTGGIAGLGGPGSRPDFSLYADGRAIAGRTLTEYHLTPDALRRLISDASKAGLATPHTVDDPRIADATYTVVTFVTGGRPRTSKIVQGGDRSGILRRFDPTTWPRGDMTTDPVPYRPAKVAVLAVATSGTGRTWPLPPLSSRIRVGTSGCTVYEGADAAKATRLVTPGTLWRDHGHTYRVTVRPLLPDESGCAALSGS